MRRVETQVGVEAKQRGISVVEYVPAELNLETVGYFSAGYKRRYPSEAQKSKVVTLSAPNRVIEIVPSAKYGYPNSDDLDFHRAFLKICDEQATVRKRQDGDNITLHPELPVFLRFSTREIIRYAGRTESARERQAVRDWIKRCTFTGIEGGLYRAETRRRESEFGGPLFSQYVLVGEKLPDGTLAATNYVWPNVWFRSNYFFRYFRPVDLTFHRRLQKAIAKTLYPILDTGWYAARGSVYAKRYADLCNILFLPAYNSLSLVKRQLDPSHEELQRERFLKSWEYVTDGDGHWGGVIRWWPGEKWTNDQEDRLGGKESALEIEELVSLIPSVDSVGDSKGGLTGNAPDDEEDSERQMAQVRAFYEKLGQPKISRQKLTGGVKVLVDLASQGFSDGEIVLAMDWVLSQKRDNGKKVYSLRLLPEVIGQVLEESGQGKKKGRELSDEQRRTADGEVDFQDTAKVYGALSAVEQDALREKAVQSLLQQGVKKEFLLDGLVRDEVFRLIRG
jgi:hypothetical protein